MRYISVLGLLIAALVSASVSADVLKGGVLKLAPGTSQIVRTNLGIHTIIIGKPEVADATVLAEDAIVVTAKSAGWTNMILLDAQQAVILQTDVQVTDVLVGPRTIQVFHGDKVQSYSCTTNCIPASTVSGSNNEVITASGSSFRNCDAARAAGASSIRRGEPGYAPHLDRDNDGVGCE